MVRAAGWLVVGVALAARAQAPYQQLVLPPDTATVGAALLASDGHLYGSRWATGPPRWELFEVAPDATGALARFTVLHTLRPEEDGTIVWSPLLEASDGRLYGTTDDWGGGVAHPGEGTLFALERDEAGRFTRFRVLHVFRHRATPGFEGDPDATDTGPPFGSLREGQDGKLYGVSWGGRGDLAATLFSVERERGSLVEAAPRGPFAVVRTVHRFWFQGPVVTPERGPLVDGPAGRLRGLAGGSGGGEVAFELDPGADGGLRVLHRFRWPFGGSQGVVAGPAGWLYGWRAGEPWRRGADAGYVNDLDSGVIFSLQLPSAGGQARGGRLREGGHPLGLVTGPPGVLFGVDLFGGAEESGSLFELRVDPATGAPLGSAVLHSFSELLPRGDLGRAPDGRLHGTVADQERSGVFVFIPLPTATSVTPGASGPPRPGTPARLSARLLQADGGVAPGEEVRFTLHDGDGGVSAGCSATTGVDGVAGCEAGTWPPVAPRLRVFFPGDVATGRREARSGLLRYVPGQGWLAP